MQLKHKPTGWLARIVVLVSFIFIINIAAADGALVLDSEREQRYRITGEFEEIRALLEFAITGQGLTISNISHISDMLQRTIKEVGGRPIFERAEALEFCSAALSRAMMQADPHNIVLCPYIIYIYTLADNPRVVYLAYRKLSATSSGAAGNDVLGQVDALLRAIIEETIE